MAQMSPGMAGCVIITIFEVKFTLVGPGNLVGRLLFCGISLVKFIGYWLMPRPRELFRRS